MWSWKPGPYICRLIPRMLPLYPHPLLLMEALSLEFGTVESLEHILRSFFATVGTSRPHTRCLQPRVPSQAAGWRSRFPGRRTSVSNLRAASSSGQPGTKRPGVPAGPMARALGMLPASRG
uniref:Uncharacterized protein n=1 Tax=Molossus molossus TaxID=27622 RepID=A0A7J8BYH2_MOLMO|nr:hypothetical protein HJG59_010048 [Molossus molossus]